MNRTRLKGQQKAFSEEQVRCGCESLRLLPLPARTQLQADSAFARVSGLEVAHSAIWCWFQRAGANVKDRVVSKRKRRCFVADETKPERTAAESILLHQ